MIPTVICNECVGGDLALLIEPFSITLMLAMATYLAISNILERGIPHNHRKGISLVKKGNYAQAIEEFKKSHEFFLRYSWIDKYRFLTLLSSSRISYAEMSLINIVSCHENLENTELSKQYYSKALELFPNSEMAKDGLNMIASFEKESPDSEE